MCCLTALRRLTIKMAFFALTVLIVYYLFVLNQARCLVSVINYYLRRAERTGEILLPAASHMPLSLRFLKQKKVCVTKRDKNAKQKNKQQGLSTDTTFPGSLCLGQLQTLRNRINFLRNQMSPAVCRLQRR